MVTEMTKTQIYRILQKNLHKMYHFVFKRHDHQYLATYLVLDASHHGRFSPRIVVFMIKLLEQVRCLPIFLGN